jgi:hypothetical protein
VTTSSALAVLDAAHAGAVTGTVDMQLDAPIAGIADATGSGGGYWEVGTDGGIFAFGSAGYFGSMGGHPLDAPIVGITSARDGQGYYEVAADGGIFAFGSAGYYGSMGGQPLDAPIVGMAVTTTGNGYYEVGADGGIFAFGTAASHGSMGGHPLNAPVVGMAVTPTGNGYYEVASDGGIFAFGTAAFDGSMGGQSLVRPIVGITTSSAAGGGYYEVAGDGGLFDFGSAPFDGSEGGQPLNAPVVGLAGDPTGGYWEVGRTGAVYAFGAPYDGGIASPTPTAPVAPAPAPALADGPAIVAVALSQVGSTDPYLYGPSGSQWCGYFASWVWQQAGIPIPSIGEADGVGTWALANGGTLLPPTATPQPGDAVLWVAPYTTNVWPDAAALNYPNIEHVNIVTQVLPGDEIVTVGGNETGEVRQLGPYSVAGASAYMGQAIYAFVQPPD